LPDTSDLDKYRAFQKILSLELIRNGKVPKHITFTSAELISAMGERKQNDRGGKLYKEVRDWLMRMKLTGIQSESEVWLAGKKTWVTDTVNVFDRVIAYGQELSDDAVSQSRQLMYQTSIVPPVVSLFLLSTRNNRRKFSYFLSLYSSIKEKISKKILTSLSDLCSNPFRIRSSVLFFSASLWSSK